MKAKWQFSRSANIWGREMTDTFLDSPKQLYKHPKKILEKVDYRGHCSSVFKMGTALLKKSVATSILRPYLCHPHHFGTETRWSHPENLSLIALFVLKIFSDLRRKTLLKSQISAAFCMELVNSYKRRLKFGFSKVSFSTKC